MRGSFYEDNDVTGVFSHGWSLRNRWGLSGLVMAALGAVVLVLYGIIPTLQPTNFGRVYAAYGGVFVVLSLLWGWKIDGVSPDTPDVIGGLIALLGVFVIMYWPR